MPVKRRLTSAEIRRKTNKPIMEKKRRERINKCLEELKSIVLRALNEESRPNKLEKADILEMTVRYLRTIKHTVHLKSEKDNILGDRTRSTIHAMVKRDYMQTGSEIPDVDFLRGSRHFENEDNLRYAPYPQPHRRQADPSYRQHISPMYNQGLLMTEQYWSCFHFDAGHRRRFPPIPTSPISDASSKSPAPMSPVEDCDKYNEPMQYNERISKQGKGCVDSNRFPPHENNNGASSLLSSASNAVYHDESLNNESSKAMGILWRPWGIAS